MNKYLPTVILIVLLLLLAVWLAADLSEIPPAPYEPAPPPYPASTAEPFDASSLDEYKDRLKLLSDDPDQITYEMLANLGSFTYFRWDSWWRESDVKSYYYVLRDGQGVEFFLRIQEKYWSGTDLYVMSVENPNDLRTSGNGGNATYRVGSVEYIYDGGVLQTIAWESKTHRFSVSLFGHDILTYDLNSDTFFGHMLDRETAQRTAKSFNARVNWGIFLRKCRPVAVVLQLAAALGLLVWGILQICKKPILFRKKVWHSIQDETIRPKYIRACGVVKLSLAAVIACMLFVLKSEPVFTLAYLILYVVLAAFPLCQQNLVNRQYKQSGEVA